jgi:GNAT superfamily N-acetyltransferase
LGPSPEGEPSRGLVYRSSGPEPPEKLRERQGRYESLEDNDRMFKSSIRRSGAGVGSVGYWAKDWHEEHVCEIAWMVVPEFQGRGIAVAATAQAVERAKRDDKHHFMHAFPSVHNAPSNAICRKLGFQLVEVCELSLSPTASQATFARVASAAGVARKSLGGAAQERRARALRDPPAGRARGARARPEGRAADGAVGRHRRV